LASEDVGVYIGFGSRSKALSATAPQRALFHGPNDRPLRRVKALTIERGESSPRQGDLDIAGHERKGMKFVIWHKVTYSEDLGFVIAKGDMLR
jgi:hypothetical protein